MSHAHSTGHTTPNGGHDAINGDNESLLAVHNGINGISTTINNHSLHNLPSPATDSPVTPVDASVAPDVKIDMDYNEQESDVRHEPLPVKHVEDTLSVSPQVGTPVDPGKYIFHRSNYIRLLF
jgi:hypothetical protein